MTAIVYTTDSDIQYAHEITEEMDHDDWYISHHPWFYGLTKNLGMKELHNGLAKKTYEMALHNQNQRVGPEIIPHPLFVEL